MADSQGRPLTAVVGCGYWGKNLVRNVHAAGALAAVCDADRDSSSGFAHEYGVRSLDYGEVLGDERLEAVVLATPAELHSGMATAALNAGKHVLVEKPLALRVHEAEELTRLAAAKGRTLMVGHLLQYHPSFLKLRELVDSGILGRLQYIYSNRLNLGKIRRSEDVFWSFAPHDISMILSLAGEAPDRVTATGASYLHRSLADVTTTHLSFPSGVNAHVFVSWLHPFKEQKLVVVGDRGMMVFDDTLPWDEKLRLFPHRVDWKNGVPQPRRADAESVSVEPAEPLLCEIEHFLDCVASGARPRTDGEEGTRVLRVLDEAARAAARGVGKDGLIADSSDAPHVPEAFFVHESSFVDEGTSIGEGTKIWHFSHVLGGCRIGRDCVIGQNVMIGPDVVIGDRCKIQNNVSLYKGVQLADGVFCGPSCVFTNVLNPRAEVERKEEFRLTRVGKGATIGANATIVCGYPIGEYAFIAAGAVVTREVAPYALVAGVPARRIGWMSRVGERLDETLTCPRTGERYGENDQGQLEPLSELELSR